jgi:TonB family protein
MLRKTTPTLILLILFACLTPAAAAGQESPSKPAWGRYMFPGDEFSVELPGQPFVFRTERDVGGRGVEFEAMWVFGVYSAGVVYMVASFDRARPSESPDDFVSYVGSRIELDHLSKKDVSLGGLKGREYQGRPGYTYRVFRTRERAYLVRAYAQAGEDAGARRFLNSLRLSARPEGTEITDAAGGGPLTGVTVRPDGDGPYKHGEVERKAVIVYKPAPAFTEEARKNNVTGVVRLRAVLSSSGRVTNISVIKPLPDGLTERAIYAARHLMFFPAQKEGREVSQYIVLEYNFNIY